mgnify:CR=1 FL=1
MTYIQILVKLRKVLRAINLESKKIQKKHGISIPQLLCLQFLADSPDYTSSATKIKDFLMLNASTVSGIISRLESKGLIARLPNRLDKRGTLITLTAKGAVLLQHTPDTLQAKLSRRLTDLSPKEAQNLNDTIDLLVEIMGANDVDIVDSEIAESIDGQ